MTRATVAVVQSATTLFDHDGAIAIVAVKAADAAALGAQLVVFPESFVGGYPKGSDFGAVVGRRTDDGREAFRTYFESAISVPGPEASQLANIARTEGIYLVVGVIEKAGSTLYCSMLTFSNQGQLLNKRRKLMGVAFERLLFGWGDGDSLEVNSTPFGRIGTLMCWENLMPAARMTLYSQGVEIYCAPTAVGTEVDVATLRHIGREGRCFVLGANLVMRAEDFPPDYVPAAKDSASALSHGGSCIVGPDGSLLAGPVWDEEVTLMADLDLDEIVRWKYDFDVVGHYSRPDIFHLIVNRTASETTL